LLIYTQYNRLSIRVYKYLFYYKRANKVFEKVYLNNFFETKLLIATKD